MPGLYVVIPRAAGTLITELIYNFDHQQHVDGRSAELMGSYGVSGSQFQLEEDPYPGGVEAIPASLAGEITRLRFVLAQIISELSGGAASNWFDNLSAPGRAFIGARVVRTTALSIPDASATVISFSGGTENFNSGAYDDMTQPSRFTAPIGGQYLATCSVVWAANSAGRRQLQIGVNGAFSNQAVITNLAPTSPQTQPQTVNGIVNLNANDYVQFVAFQNSGSSINLTPADSFSIAGALVFMGAA